MSMMKTGAWDPTDAEKQTGLTAKDILETHLATAAEKR